MSENSSSTTSIGRIRDALGRVGFTHERKALALSILGLFSSYFLLLMLIARDQMPEWYPAFSAMFALYFIAFFGVAAHWFWGRWVAIGLGSWGATIAIWGCITQRAFEPALVILGVTHGLVALLLMGSSMGAHYEGRADWRTRFGLDDEGVKRLRRSVTRAASSLPAIVLFALAPRQDDGAVLLLVAALGIGGLLLGRSISLFALAAASIGAFRSRSTRLRPRSRRARCRCCCQSPSPRRRSASSPALRSPPRWSRSWAHRALPHASRVAPTHLPPSRSSSRAQSPDSSSAEIVPLATANAVATGTVWRK